MMDSCPPRPFTIGEGELLSRESAGMVLPGAFIQSPALGMFGYVGMVLLDPSEPNAVFGFDPDDREWSMICTEDPETPAREMFDLLDEWVADAYGVER